ncbi:unnamed protein product [Symbiodinium sp. KB8]|nr:unnamed protein product [Symbiodinium sp. KB8]
MFLDLTPDYTPDVVIVGLRKGTPVRDALFEIEDVRHQEFVVIFDLRAMNVFLSLYRLLELVLRQVSAGTEDVKRAVEGAYTEAQASREEWRKGLKPSFGW